MSLIKLRISHAFRFSKSNYIIKPVYLRAKIKYISEFLTNRKYLLVGKLFGNREKITINNNVYACTYTTLFLIVLNELELL